MFKTLLAVFIAFATQQAFACSYDPQIETNKKLLLAVALKKIKLATEDLKSHSVEFNFEESKPTPMCPNEIRYTGVYTLNWTSGKDLAMQKPCSANVTVVKTVNYEKSRIKPRVRTTAKNNGVICAP